MTEKVCISDLPQHRTMRVYGVEELLVNTNNLKNDGCYFINFNTNL